MKERNRTMRIGRTIIDLDSLTTEDLTMIIDEARHIRKRRELIEEYKFRMHVLLTEAKEAGLDFIDKDFGNVIRPEDLELYDNH